MLDFYLTAINDNRTIVGSKIILDKQRKSEKQNSFLKTFLEIYTFKFLNC